LREIIARKGAKAQFYTLTSIKPSFMQEQNYQNHTRYIPAYHFITSGALLVLLIGSIINLCTSTEENLYSASLIVMSTIVMIPLYWWVRSFALKAQDRAIRAEENFRHFILTGSPLPQGLGMGQVVALRFASDAEFPGLAVRAINEKISGNEIKQAIQNWRADHYRA
jgi:hypothetical protein